MGSDDQDDREGTVPPVGGLVPTELPYPLPDAATLAAMSALAERAAKPFWYAVTDDDIKALAALLLQYQSGLLARALQIESEEGFESDSTFIRHSDANAPQMLSPGTAVRVFIKALGLDWTVRVFGLRESGVIQGLVIASNGRTPSQLGVKPIRVTLSCSERDTFFVNFGWVNAAEEADEQ